MVAGTLFLVAAWVFRGTKADFLTGYCAHLLRYLDLSERTCEIGTSAHGRQGSKEGSYEGWKAIEYSFIRPPLVRHLVQHLEQTL